MAEKTKAASKLRRINGIVFALAALIIIVSIGSGKFLSWNNISNVLRQIVPLGIMACAGTYVIITGNIDLSVGSTLSFCALLSCNLVGVSTVLAIVAPMALGAACGLFNGLLVGRLRFNPFIATLGTMSVIQALAFFYCDGKFLSAGPNDAYKQIGQGFFLGIPLPVYLLLAVFIVLTVVLSKTTFGRAVYIVGGNPICAKYSGISYGRTISLAYMLSGMAAAVSAIVLVARQMAAQPEMGAGYEFDVVTAVVLGGVALSGGKGTIWSALLGVLFIGIMKNAFILLDIKLYYQYIVMGVILILAIYSDVLSERRASRARNA